MEGTADLGDDLTPQSLSAEEREQRVGCCLRYRLYWILPLILAGLTTTALGIATIALTDDPYEGGPDMGFWIFIAGMGFVGLCLSFLAIAGHCIHGRDSAWRRRLRAQQMQNNHQRLEEALDANAANEVIFDNDHENDLVAETEDEHQATAASTSEIELDNPNSKH